jgi:hypothetical protein
VSSALIVETLDELEDGNARLGLRLGDAESSNSHSSAAKKLSAIALS